MKLTAISVLNFLGARAVEVQLTKPVTLFAGKNGAGKSSVQEAVRMALTGEAVRVGLKKDYGQLISEGAKEGSAEVVINGSVSAWVTLPDGRNTPASKYVPSTALPYVLDAQRFAKLDPNERRAFLFGLMGLSADGAEVKKRLLLKGCNDQKVDSIMPMLRSGFDAAHKEAQAKARDEKTAWRTITGETYGEKKAASWAPEKPAFDAGAVAELERRLDALNAEIGAANQRLGALQADHKRRSESAQWLAGLRERSMQYARIADKLNRDESDLAAWKIKLEQAKISLDQSKKQALTCPHCEGQVTLHAGTLSPYKPEAVWGDPIEIQKTVNDGTAAVQLLENAVANGRRDLASADLAAKALAEITSFDENAPDESAIESVKGELSELARRKQATAELYEAQCRAARKAKQADECTAKALSAHESVLAWIAIADALAPDGIPGEILAEALTPLNERLKDAAEISEWSHVTVTRDMQVLAGGRPYALLSESEKWRADAMLAEAISYISKTKLLVLDRFDVLDMQSREDLIAWLHVLAQDGEIDSALIFGTLKALPGNLPQTCSAFWLENGIVDKLMEAA